MDFKNSQTKLNLMKAFAGESQARNRYTFAACEAKKQKFEVIEKLFLFTANQEKEHAELFYNELKEMTGENITVDGTYPVDISQDVVSLLRKAVHNEFEEYSPVYSDFSKIAKEEGFLSVSTLFSNIAEIEKVHGERFEYFADLMEKNKLFSDDKETKWICLNCGHIHYGTDAPMKCPVCSHSQGYFIRYTQGFNI